VAKKTQEFSGIHDLNNLKFVLIRAIRGRKKTQKIIRDKK